MVQDEDPDVVVIDAMFSTALDVAPRFDRPTTVMLHTFFDRLLVGWRATFAMQSESRQRVGFAGLPDLDARWGERDLFHVNALGAFDGEPATSWKHVIQGAPVSTSEQRAVPTKLPWGIAATSLETLFWRVAWRACPRAGRWEYADGEHPSRDDAPRAGVLG